MKGNRVLLAAMFAMATIGMSIVGASTASATSPQSLSPQLVLTVHGETQSSCQSQVNHYKSIGYVVMSPCSWYFDGYYSDWEATVRSGIS